MISKLDIWELLSKHNIKSRELADLSTNGKLPFNDIELIFSELEKTTPLNDKKLLDIGCSDFRVSLYALMHGMQVTAIEKDAELSGEVGKIFDEAIGKYPDLKELFNFIPNTNVLDIEWKDYDVVIFYYTEPNYLSSQYVDGTIEVWEKHLGGKIGELKPGAIVIFIFIDARIKRERLISPEDPISVKFPMLKSSLPDIITSNNRYVRIKIMGKA